MNSKMKYSTYLVNSGVSILHRFLVLFMLFCSIAVFAQDDAAKEDIAREKAMVQLGLQHDSAWELFQALRDDAEGGKPLTWKSMPDWTGLWSRFTHFSSAGFRFDFDPDEPNPPLTTAKLTPEAYKLLKQRVAKARKGQLYDKALGSCGPPGFPRWLAVPFLREFIVRPEQTWLSSETVNNVRRIYTDGRGHMDELDRYPTYYGDSIGFWDGHKLVIHTNQLMAGTYGRAQPDHTEQTETVEVWEKVETGRMRVLTWIYDPSILQEPWYNEFIYVREPNEDKRVRLRYWHCGENSNNDVYETIDGGTQLKSFSFGDEDANISGQENSSQGEPK